MKERASATLESQKDKAVDGLGTVAQAVRQSSEQLRNQQHDTLATYVERATGQIDRWSDQLRDKHVGELVDDAQRFARRRPALFVGSAFALGVISARLLKSSAPGHDGHSERRYDATARGRTAAGTTAYQAASAGRTGSVGRPGAGTTGRADIAGTLPGSPTRVAPTSTRGRGAGPGAASTPPRPGETERS